MFLIPVVDFRGRFEHVIAPFRHIWDTSTHKGGVSASRLYCVWGC